jgi:hypothetical protein
MVDTPIWPKRSVRMRSEHRESCWQLRDSRISPFLLDSPLGHPAPLNANKLRSKAYGVVLSPLNNQYHPLLTNHNNACDDYSTCGALTRPSP